MGGLIARGAVVGYVCSLGCGWARGNGADVAIGSRCPTCEAREAGFPPLTFRAEEWRMVGEPTVWPVSVGKVGKAEVVSVESRVGTAMTMEAYAAQRMGVPGAEYDVAGRTERCERHNVIYFPGGACGLCADEMSDRSFAGESAVGSLEEVVSDLDREDAIMTAVRDVARGG